MSISLAPKGSTFTRLAIALAVSAAQKGLVPARFAETRWGASSPAAMVARAAFSGAIPGESWAAEIINRAAIPAGASDGSTWGDELAQLQSMSDDFIDLLRPQTIIGRIASLRRAPFKTPIPRQLTGTNVAFVQEGATSQVSKMTFDRTSLDPAKVAGIVVLTDELIRHASVDAERLVRNDLVAQVQQFSDYAFIDPANTGTAYSPAAVTAGASTIATSGNAADDVKALIAAFNGDLQQAYLVTDPKTAASMNSADLPDIGVRGGQALGLPVLTSNGSPVDSNGGQLALIDGSGILMAESAIEVSASKEATIEMSDTPTGDSTTPAGASMVSMFQTDSTALLIVRFMNWEVARSGSVLVIPSTSY